MASLTEKLGGEGGLSWEKFDTTVSKQAVRFPEFNIKNSWLKHATGNYRRWAVPNLRHLQGSIRGAMSSDKAGSLRHQLS
jgi:hypothetical protein